MYLKENIKLIYVKSLRFHEAYGMHIYLYQISFKAYVNKIYSLIIKPTFYRFLSFWPSYLNDS